MLLEKHSTIMLCLARIYQSSQSWGLGVSLSCSINFCKSVLDLQCSIIINNYNYAGKDCALLRAHAMLDGERLDMAIL